MHSMGVSATVPLDAGVLNHLDRVVIARDRYGFVQSQQTDDTPNHVWLGVSLFVRLLTATHQGENSPFAGLPGNGFVPAAVSRPRYLQW